MKTTCSLLLAGSALVCCGCAVQPEQRADKAPTAQPAQAEPAAPMAAPMVVQVELPSPPPMPPLPALPAPGESTRVGGDMAAAAEKRADDYVAGRCAITTPLPEGYPPPTPPGAIDLKTYPSVRRAEVRGEMNADIGMNFGFFPLFNHIKRRDIAMTSPVEMDYGGLSPATRDQPAGNWTMSFLYRQAEMGPAGADESDKRITVVDTPQKSVVALGLRGAYSLARIRRGLGELETWLADHPRWEAVGSARALYYNGPERSNADKWAEVQIEVRPAAERAETNPGR